ncbi:MAG: 5-formyltetrahydrofolate cyclo-ligase [Aquabacterium sp.]|jgi:5,10-methenyltetrahydrofolate synthetase
MAHAPLPDDRAALRRTLIQQRRAWWDNAATRTAADAALAELLWRVLEQLEPDCLGVYWALPGEFNPNTLALRAQQVLGCRLALPRSHKSPAEMHYQLWDGQPPTERDEHGIACAQGARVVPDVVLAPCVGHTRQAYRMGYGGGYFDRFLAAHPEVVAIGLSWEGGDLTSTSWTPGKHDVPLAAVITERNIWSD